jgi:superfamily II DNA helicase RecQ
MGIDVEDCNGVVMYGPPSTAVDFLQESGRVGRNNDKSVSVLLYHSYQLQNVDDDIKSLLKETTCRRLSIMNCFVKSQELEEIKSRHYKKHDCCDLCEKKCDCKQCVTLPLEKILELSDLGVATTDEVSDSDSDSNTISYIYQSASDTDDALLDLNLENALSL